MKDDSILVNDIDLHRRTEDEWSEIYHIQLANNDILSADLMDEFEWAWYMQDLNYYPLEINGSYEDAEQKELRHNNIITDILLHADIKEKKILLHEHQFIQTQYMTQYRANH